MSFDFSARRVLVTGGSNGIGRAIAGAFAAAGADVTITGTRERNAYEDGFAQLTYRQLQVQDPDAIDALAADVDELDILVNNAGTAHLSDPSEAEPEGFAATMSVNLLAVHRLSVRLHDALARRSGSIVNVASMYSYFGSAPFPGYAASKGGVVQLTKSLAVAWAADGIRVNAIAPGWIVTNLTGFLHDDPAFSGGIRERTPLARWGHPEDCAGAVLYLCSSAAAFVTGAVLNVDGGYSVM
ncbi:MAG: SDR family oxidoreductase [Acidimicrobiales bacterium]